MPADARALTLEDFWSLSQVSDPRLSPDGTMVADVVTTHDEARNAACSYMQWKLAIDWFTQHLAARVE
ncbi:MAG TPA: hypothetical protein VNL35_17905 [Chloroflexota bacterium]|nr:hypothetical protein [Chloroflexota bacterium]